jgi:hypothetical protein
MTSTVSQPTVSSQDSAAAAGCRCTPNAARDSTIVGADPRLPASAITPHSANETTMPDDAGDHRPARTRPERQRERAVADAQHEMFDANQGQNSDRGRPERALSGTTSMPISLDPARPPRPASFFRAGHRPPPRAGPSHQGI